MDVVAVTPDRGFADLYDAHLDFVWRNLRALGVPAADVEDAAQDTFVVAYRRQKDFKPGASMRAWLYGIARRVAYRQRRGGGRRARLADAFAIEPREPSSLEGLAQTQQEWEIAMAALDGLPALQREAFWLTEMEGLTAAEAGGALGVSGNTISSRLRSARQGLARHGEVLRARDDGELKRAAARAGGPSAAQRSSAVAALAVRMQGLASVPSSVVTLGWWASAAGLVIAGVALAGGRTPDASTQPEPVRAVAQTQPATLPETERPEKQRPAAAALSAVPQRVEVPVPATLRPKGGRRPNVSSEDSLAAEAKMVRTIKNSLSSDPARALMLVATYEQTFSGGVLSQEASALAVQAACRLGQDSTARAKAAALPAAHVWASVKERGCPTTLLPKRDTKDTAPGEGGGR